MLGNHTGLCNAIHTIRHSRMDADERNKKRKLNTLLEIANGVMYNNDNELCQLAWLFDSIEISANSQTYSI